MDLRWIDNDENVAILYANHYVSKFSAKELKVLKNIACEQRCLLYSGLIVGDVWEDLYVFSGTIFSEVLLWKPSEEPFFSPVICALKGHDVSNSLPKINTYLESHPVDGPGWNAVTISEDKKLIGKGYSMICWLSQPLPISNLTI